MVGLQYPLALTTTIEFSNDVITRWVVESFLDGSRSTVEQDRIPSPVAGQQPQWHDIQDAYRYGTVDALSVWKRAVHCQERGSNCVFFLGSHTSIDGSHIKEVIFST